MALREFLWEVMRSRILGILPSTERSIPTCSADEEKGILYPSKDSGLQSAILMVTKDCDMRGEPLVKWDLVLLHNPLEFAV